jgi:hypothetical protein
MIYRILKVKLSDEFQGKKKAARKDRLLVGLPLEGVLEF